MPNKISEIPNVLAEQYDFSGGPRDQFEAVGRHTFITLLQNGLRPDSLVLDYGCGVMRLGWWIMRFLDPGCYYAIEPNEKHLETGKAIVIGEDLIGQKKPVFSSDANFDLAVFDQRFDFIVARSIFTHFTPAAIERVLISLPRALSPNGIFIASFWPSSGTNPANEKKSQRLVGERLTDRPAKAGINVAYAESSLIGIAERVGILAERLPAPVCAGQPWIKYTVAQKPAQRGLHPPP